MLAFNLLIDEGCNLRNYDEFVKYLNNILRNKKSTRQIHIVCGSAEGSGCLSEQFALENGYEYLAIPADYHSFGKRAEFIQNVELINASDAVVIFWDGSTEPPDHLTRLVEMTYKSLRIVNHAHRGW